LEADVVGISARMLRAYVPGLRGGVAIVIGGPPCQGYSTAGPRDPSAERNFLFRHIARVARELKAVGVVIENVPGARGVRGVDFSEPISEELSRSGFVARTYHLYAPDFGVPQNRERLFFVGLAKNLGIVPTRPRPTHSWPGSTPSRAGRPRTSTLSELMKQLPEREEGVLEDAMELDDGTVVYNAATMAHSPRVVRKISGIPVGKGPLSYRRLDSELAATIVAGHRALPVHPWLDRTISVREAASIQGFPVSYVFCGSRSQQPLQVANAVPPPVAEGLAAHLRGLLGALEQKL
jgi:DNA (cytosine-5)-methyltransferase 1